VFIGIPTEQTYGAAKALDGIIVTLHLYQILHIVVRIGIWVILILIAIHANDPDDRHGSTPIALPT